MIFLGIFIGAALVTLLQVVTYCVWLRPHYIARFKKAEALSDTATTYAKMGMLDDAYECLDEANELMGK